MFAEVNTTHAESIKSVFKKRSSIKDPFGLRDPFKPPFERKKISFSHKKKKTEGLSAVEVMKSIAIENIRVVGVLVGKERRAVVTVEGHGKKTFLLNEGMLIGVDKAILKAILPGGIVLVEKIKNVYDDDEYIETIIPLSLN